MPVEIQKREEKPLEYVPFGASDPIRLSIQIVQNIIAVKTKTGKTCSQQDAMKFMMLCQSQRLNPFAGDCFLVGYDKKQFDGTFLPQFSLITAHQAFLKRAETCADYEGNESGIILLKEDGTTVDREGDFALPEEKVVGGWCKVYRKNRRPTLRRVSVAAMRPNYDTPFWSEEKAPGQIVKCAEADALRSTFPTLLGGLYAQDEIYEVGKFVQASSNGRAAALVEVAPSPRSEIPPADPPEPGLDPNDGDLGPQSTPAPQSARAQSNRDELSRFVTSEGFTFTHLQKWGVESGNIPAADAMAEFDDLPDDVCKRLLRAKAGLLKGLALAKGGDK